MVGFLKTELKLARTFTNIASAAVRLRSNARKAYDTILYFLEKSGLSENKSEDFAVDLEALKSNLEQLGETFPSKARSGRHV